MLVDRTPLTTHSETAGTGTQLSHALGYDVLGARRSVLSSTLKLVVNSEGRRPARSALSDVLVCKSITRSRMTLETPMPLMAFQSAIMSTKSKADFRSRNAENIYSGC